MIKSNVEKFISKANLIHDNKYDYSKVEYINSQTKICIICKEHGEFYMRPNDHLNGQGCPFERYEIISIKLAMGVEKFMNKAKLIHGDKYDYSKVNYTNNRKKVCIICLVHGEFWQRPDKHLNGQGCPECAKENNNIDSRKTLTQFLEQAKIVQGDKYDYSKVKYVNNHTKIYIICPEHGEFWQTPGSHLSGARCPKCHHIPILEKEMFDFLTYNNIKFVEQQTFKWLRGKSKPQRLDFYLPEYNIGIECQGEQHFKPVKYFGGEKRYNKIKWRDNNKFKLCEEHEIKIIYYSKESVITKDFTEYNVLTDLNIIKLIIKGENEK